MDTPKSSSIALEFAVNDLANMRRTCDRLRAENAELLALIALIPPGDPLWPSARRIIRASTHAALAKPAA